MFFRCHKSILFLLPSITVYCFFFWMQCAACGETSVDTTWLELTSEHTIIRFQTVEDLKKFYFNIDFGPEHWGLEQLLTANGQDKLFDKVGEKIDALFLRVQEILDMRKKTEKVTIQLYHDQKQLHDAYTILFGKETGFRAWYIYERNTVYLAVDDVHAGMLAHEIAHSIIDHYLLVRPPKATAEILARYVDKHLSK